MSDDLNQFLGECPTHKKLPWKIGAMESGRVAIDSDDDQEVTGWIDPEDAYLILSQQQIIESLRQQLSDSQKQVVMLRNLVEELMVQYSYPVLAKYEEALAATAYLDGVWCEKEPRAAELMVRNDKTDWRRYNVYDDVKTAEWHADKAKGPPLQIKVMPLYAAAEVGE